MNQKHLLLAALVAATGAAIYAFYNLEKTKKYIKSLPAPMGTVDGMPPHA